MGGLTKDEEGCYYASHFLSTYTVNGTYKWTLNTHLYLCFSAPGGHSKPLRSIFVSPRAKAYARAWHRHCKNEVA